MRVGELGLHIDAPDRLGDAVGCEDAAELVAEEGGPAVALHLDGRFFDGEGQLAHVVAEAEAVGDESGRGEDLVARASVDLECIEDGDEVGALRVTQA